MVCGGGVSATVCEHSALDGLSVEPLHSFINQAIQEFDTVSSSTPQERAWASAAVLQQITLTPSKAMNERISQLRRDPQVATRLYSFAHIETLDFGNNFLSMQKCPVQSGIQLAIQLASRRFFGYQPPALETVSMATFRKGRVEVHHIIQPPMAKFLTAATDDGIIARSGLRALAFEAAKAHAKSLSQASKGRGFSRHMLAMEWMLRDDETEPSLFSDPVYARMKPGKVLTSAFKTGWVEGGFVYPVPGSILVYFEIKDER